MKTYIEERVIDIADYIIDNNATVRKAAKQFGVSKSTAHKDVTTRLLEIDPQLAAEVRKILDSNKQERHIRGGLATKEKYSHITFYISHFILYILHFVFYKLHFVRYT